MYNVWKAITPSDTVNIDPVGNTQVDAIYVGVAGNVVAVMQGGNTGTFTAVAGEVLPLRAVRVNSSGTTASSLLALYL